MNRTVKLITKYIVFGISCGCTILVLNCLISSIIGERELLNLIMADFTKQSIGFMLVGIASCSPAFVYQLDYLSEITKIIIHFCIGMAVFYPIAIYLGWIPFYPDQIVYTIIQFLILCGIFFIIWSCFYFFNRNEAKKINNKLRELDHYSNK